MGKKKILYCEDDKILLESVPKNLKKKFPAYEIIAAEDIIHINFDELNVGELEIACIDGELLDSKGWDIAKKLKEKGYQGPILYIGASEIPEEFKDLFDEKTFGIKYGEVLINSIKKFLK